MRNLFSKDKKYRTYILVSMMLLPLLLLIVMHNLPIKSAYSLSDSLNLGGQSKQIAVGTSKDGSLAIFSIGLKYNVPYYKSQIKPAGNWSSSWIDLGPTQSKQIAVGTSKDGSLAIFSVGLGNNITYYKYQLQPNGINWSNSIKLGGQSKQIAVGTSKDGSLAIFSIGLKYNVPYYKSQIKPGSPAGNWSSSWIDLGPTQSKQIAVGTSKDGRLVLFSVDLGNNMYYKYQLQPNGINWSNSIKLGGQSKQIAVGTSKDGSLAIFSVNPSNNNIYYKSQIKPGSPAGNWSSSWIDLGPTQSKQIAVGNGLDGRLVLASLNLNDSISYKYQTRSGSPPIGGWSNWVNLGGQSRQVAVGNGQDGGGFFTIGQGNNVIYYNKLEGITKTVNPFAPNDSTGNGATVTGIPWLIP